MADAKISQLPPSGAFAATMQFAENNSGITERLTGTQLTAGVLANAGFTAGSVLFAGATGEITEDSTNFLWTSGTNTLAVVGDYENVNGKSFYRATANTSNTSSFTIEPTLIGAVPGSEFATVKFIGLSGGAQHTFFEYTGGSGEITQDALSYTYLTKGGSTTRLAYKTVFNTAATIHYQNQLFARNSINLSLIYTQLDSWIQTNTSTLEDGMYEISVMEAGTLTSYVQFDGKAQQIKLEAKLTNSAANWEISTLGDAIFGDVKVNANFIVKRTASAVSTTTGAQVIIGITDTSAPRTVTLQTADTLDGIRFLIKDESGAAGTNNITIDTEGAQTIDGAASIDITVNYGCLRVYSDGTNWFTR